jgi:virulence factor
MRLAGTSVPWQAGLLRAPRAGDPTAPLRVGLAGAGRMGANHARVISSVASHCELAAVYDPDQGRAAELARHWGGRTVPTFAELLERCDAVVLASASTVHAEQVRACLAAGRHVLVEKPVAMDAATACELRDAAAAFPELVVQVGHIEHFNPSVREVRKLLTTETPFVVSARRLGPSSPRSEPIHVVSDLMLHDIHVIVSLDPGELVSVSSAGVAFPGSAPDYAHATLVFDSGLIAHLSASRLTEEKIRELEVTTASAHITADYARRTVEVSRCTNLEQRTPASSGYRQESVVEKIFVPVEEPLVAEIRAFVDAARYGREPEVGLDVAARCMTIVETVQDSMLVQERPRLAA